jgi:hypothetical protein
MLSNPGCKTAPPDVMSRLTIGLECWKEIDSLKTDNILSSISKFSGFAFAV